MPLERSMLDLTSKIMSLCILLIPPMGVWLYYRRAKQKILSSPASTKMEIANRNQNLKEWKFHYKENFAKYSIPALILATVLSIGGSMMDKKDEKLSNIEKKINELSESYDSRIKNIEVYLWPPTGPTSPTIFERLDEMEKSKDEIEALLLRVTDPYPELRMKVKELEQQIIMLRKELEAVKSHVNGGQVSELTAEL